MGDGVLLGFGVAVGAGVEDGVDGFALVDGFGVAAEDGFGVAVVSSGFWDDVGEADASVLSLGEGDAGSVLA